MSSSDKNQLKHGTPKWNKQFENDWLVKEMMETEDGFPDRNYIKRETERLLKEHPELLK